MTKSRTDRKTELETPVELTLTEQCAIEDLRQIMLVKEFNLNTNEIKYIRKLINGRGQITCQYKPADGSDSGRLYCSDSSQFLSKNVRNFLHHGKIELDLSSAAINILREQMFIINVKTPNMDNYVKLYDEICKTPEGLKLKFRAREQIFDPTRKPVGNESEKQLLAEISECALKLGDSGTEIAKIIFEKEYELIKSVIESCKRNNVRVNTYIFDAIIVDDSPNLHNVPHHFNLSKFHRLKHNLLIKPKVTMYDANKFDFEDPTTVSDLSSYYGHEYPDKDHLISAIYKTLIKTTRCIDFSLLITKRSGRDVKITKSKDIGYVFDTKKGQENLLAVVREIPALNFEGYTWLRPTPKMFSCFPEFLVSGEKALENYTDHIKPILYHIHNVWSDGDEAMSDFMFDWFAHIVQHHPKLTETILVLNGDEGTGKSLMFDFIHNKIFGRLCLVVTGTDKVTRSFNKHLAGKLLVCMEEIKGESGGSYKHDLNRLKHLATSTTMDVEQKGLDVITDTNAMNIMAFSNYDTPLPPIKGINRRLVQCTVSTRHQGDSKYFKALGDYLENDPHAAECFMKFLMTRKINYENLRFNKPQSADKLLAKWNCLHDVDKGIYALLQKNPEGLELRPSEHVEYMRLFSDRKWEPVWIGRRFTALKIPKKHANDGTHYRITPETFKVDKEMMACCVEYMDCNDQLDELPPVEDLLN